VHLVTGVLKFSNTILAKFSGDPWVRPIHGSCTWVMYGSVCRERFVKFVQPGSVAYQHAKLGFLRTSRRSCDFSSRGRTPATPVSNRSLKFSINSLTPTSYQWSVDIFSLGLSPTISRLFASFYRLSHLLRHFTSSEMSETGSDVTNLNEIFLKLSTFVTFDIVGLYMIAID
jgi:hypothetical protein